MLRRPWDVSRMTSGSAPISFPTLHRECKDAELASFLQDANGFMALRRWAEFLGPFSDARDEGEMR